ncbi:MAG: Trm112 family protein [Mycobacteriales bacterium]
MKLDPVLLEILACPNCHAGLVADDADQTLDCTGCGYRYPVRDDIPVMLVDEAIKP